MKSRVYLILFILTIPLCGFAQDTIQNNYVNALQTVNTLTKTHKLTRIPLRIRTKTHLLPFSYWSKKNSVGFDISEVAFVNWSAGGTSSISGLLKGKFHRNYARDNYNWSNELIIKYGLNKQDGVAIRKTEDAIHSNAASLYLTCFNKIF